MKTRLLTLAVAAMATLGMFAAPVKVGVYVDLGAQSNGLCYWEMLTALSPDIEVSYLDAKGIADGALDKVEVLAMPGGSSILEFETLRKAGADEKVRDFIRNGGGYVGTCAGNCIVLNENKRLRLTPYAREASSGRHGTALLTLKFNARAKEMCGIRPGAHAVRYSGGPVMKPGKPVEGANIETIAVYDCDLVCSYGTNTSRIAAMKGAPAAICGTYGKGRLFAIATHPEYRADTLDILEGAFRYVTGGREVKFVRPQRKAGDVSVAVYAKCMEGLKDAEMVRRLVTTPGLDVAFMNQAEEIGVGWLDHMDALVLPFGSSAKYGKKFDAKSAPFLARFVAQGGKVFRCGEHAAKHAPKGTVACADLEALVAGLKGVAAASGAPAAAETVPEPADDDVEAFRQLLSIRSVSKDVAANDRATEWMRRYLEKRGVWCAVETFPKDGRKILYAATKPGLRNPDYVMVTHLDVVDAPAEQFVPQVKGDRIYARGACDTKGNALCAAKVLCALKGKASVGCVFASDEEIGGNTTKHMVALGYGEPGRLVVTLDCSGRTGNIPYACKGNGYYRVTATGKSGHSSNPFACDNPIYRLAEAALRVRDRFPFQKPGEWGDVASVTIVGGGDSQNRIPETAEMTVNVRFVEPDGLERHLKTIAEVTGLKTELIRGTPPGIGPGDSPELLAFRDAMKKAYPERACELVRSAAATDARYFTRFGKPLPMIGMDCGGGHGADEWCDVRDFERMTRFLVEFFSR